MSVPGAGIHRHPFLDYFRQFFFGILRVAIEVGVGCPAKEGLHDGGVGTRASCGCFGLSFWDTVNFCLVSTLLRLTEVVWWCYSRGVANVRAPAARSVFAGLAAVTFICPGTSGYVGGVAIRKDI